jgi:hypothetical protein
MIDNQKIRKILSNLGLYKAGKQDPQDYRAELVGLANRLPPADLRAITRLGRVLTQAPRQVKAHKPDYLKILSATEGEEITRIDYLKLLDEIPGKNIEEPNYLDLLDEA